MDQVLDPANLSMHAIQMCSLPGQVVLHEVVPELPVNLGIPLVAWCAARGFTFVGGCVRRGSHGLIGKRFCFAPAPYVHNITHVIHAGSCSLHDICVLLAQEVVTFLMTGLGV